MSEDFRQFDGFQLVFFPKRFGHGWDSLSIAFQEEYLLFTLPGLQYGESGRAPPEDDRLSLDSSFTHG